jgi:SAM-dependent methyltransferase
MVFNNYAKYYNLLYRDKDYEAEVNHIHSLIKQFSQEPITKLLDIGCGTGTHASFMAKLGYNITGIDLSPEMINQAIAKKIPGSQFYVGNAIDFKCQDQFNAITSLFHVFSYQTVNSNAEAMIKNASEQLKPNGLFLFDFWYGPAVLIERPSVKVRRLESAEIKVTRIAEPVLKINENVVDVNFELLIYDKEHNYTELIREVHPMRYFFKPEIEFFLEKAGMGMLYFKEWLTGKEPSEATWGVCCVAVKTEMR